ncbi:hypothetical protein ACHAO9_012618 [Fusarium lateritium]
MPRKRAHGHGQNDHGRNDYGQNDHGRNDYGQNDYDQIGYGQNGDGQNGDDQNDYSQDDYDRYDYDRSDYDQGQNDHDQDARGQVARGQAARSQVARGQAARGQADHDRYDHGHNQIGYGQNGYDQNYHSQDDYGRYDYDRNDYDRYEHGQDAHTQNDHDRNDHDQNIYGEDGHGEDERDRNGQDRNDHNQAVMQHQEPSNSEAVRVDSLTTAVFQDAFVSVETSRLQPRSNATEGDSQANQASQSQLRPQLRPRPRIQPAPPAANPFSGQWGSLTFVEKAVVYELSPPHSSSPIFVRNEKREGPHINICWKVPGKHVWLARVSSIDINTELLAMVQALGPPGRSCFGAIWSFEKDSVISLIISTHESEDGERVENGEGEVIPEGRERIPTLGRLLGFQVKKSHLDYVMNLCYPPPGYHWGRGDIYASNHRSL